MKLYPENALNIEIMRDTNSKINLYRILFLNNEKYSSWD